ncbi:DNA recombination protein RecO [Erythrobacteraceae bacterium CFH 75059]|uniref:DNA repair protein RecO n=1 Tax=Qipengyuania thermophila TaxID=2509361 RepID=UPI00101FC020|nr:recombination protein O N-terminal domain-containing protein [Qipengyuania thermophila]TCD02212.1 DNA recombination protein RecO [Erythrobacteraceae bacterium CFH 75059]
MRLRDEAIVLGVRAHGESGSIARLLTRGFGVVAGYVPGGRGRTLRPVLIPGNGVMVDISARADSQMPSLRLELATSRAPVASQPLPAAALAWVTALAASALPERSAYPALFDALDGVIRAVEAAPSARQWVTALIAYERLLLRDLGYGEARLPVPEDHAGRVALFTAQRRAVGRYLLHDRGEAVLALRGLLEERLGRTV